MAAMKISRRSLFRGAAAMGALSLGTNSAAPAFSRQPETAMALASDERFWAQIAKDFDISPDIINLENGYWGLMARPVLEDYIVHTRAVNRNNSFYARREYNKDAAAVLTRTAAALGADEGEIAITRGATEALQALIGGYDKLKPGDAVMYADLDYYSMKSAMDWTAKRHGCDVVRLEIPQPVSYDQLIEFYTEALAANPRVRLLLLTHISHRTGLMIPVKAITKAARAMGVDVIVDAAHSFGQVDIKIEDLGADFIGFNLHKWIGAPIGTGAMYIRKTRLEDIAPNLASDSSEKHRLSGRIHTGTSNFAAILTLPAAFDYHERIGRQNKQARLRYLRNLWVEAVSDLEMLEILTPNDERLHGGITSFRLRGKTSVDDNKAIAERLVQEFGIFTTHRDGVAKGACVRVTPAIYNSADDCHRLAMALRKITT